jgi:hypothetical protein
VTSVPDSLLRFRGDLEEEISRDLARGRLGWQAAFTLAAAIATAIAAFLLVGGGGPSIVDQAEAALTAGGGSLLHIRMLGSRTEPDGSVVRWEDEHWLVSGARGPRRQIETTADGRRVETATTEDGVAQVYDPATNTIYAARALPPPTSTPQHSQSGFRDESGVRVPLSPQMEIKRLLTAAGGNLRDEGRVAVDGREALRLVSEAQT